MEQGVSKRVAAVRVSTHTLDIFQNSTFCNMVQEQTLVVPGQPHLICSVGLLLMYGELDHCQR